MGLHTPSVPPVKAAVQASQMPAQAVAQHTPSTHFKLVHSSAAVQAKPFGVVPQTPPAVQVCPPGHSFCGSV
jgi:hypothetical protein